MRTAYRVVATVVAVLLLAGAARAQTATGQILGTVKDASGGIMPKVKVVVTNTQTGLTRETTTGDNGTYVVPLLPAGAYVVTAEQTGFKLAVLSDIQLNVDQVQRVDFQLETGNISEKVEVTANASTIDTQSASVGHVITEKQVTDLPLNGRNFLQLLFLGAGAVETGGEQGGMRQGVGNAISIMGARPTSNNFMIDGTANIDTSLGTPAAVLSVDAIQEFKEQTTTYSAEYGFSSNQINLVSKTGTNQFHGTGFGFFRNEAWDARNFFDNKSVAGAGAGSEAVRVRCRRPGVSRNRTFFLVNYEGTRIDRGATNFYTVPTQEQLAGRFSTPIIDPTTGTPFPNNTIPQSQLLAAGPAGGPEQLVSRSEHNGGAGELPGRTHVSAERRTSSPSAVTRTWGSGSAVCSSATPTPRMRTPTPATRSISATACSCRTRRTGRCRTPGRSAAISSTNSGWGAWTPGQISTESRCPQTDVDSLGVTGTFQDIPDDQRECPSIAMQGYSGTGGAVNVYTASNQPMWDVSNTTTWVKGSHTLNFGANFRRWWLQRDLATGFLGNYTYNVGFTGNVVADMLLGYYSGVGVFQPAAYSVPGAAGNPREFNFMYFAPYFQDDWRVNERLTVNLGLRWDYRNVPYETNNRMAWRNLDYGPGGLLVADESLVAGGIVDGNYYQYADRRSPENPDRFKVFAPRIGFAWRPFDEQTVIRGGFGVFYDSAEGREIDGAADVYPYVSRGSYPQSVGQSAPLQTTDSLFPSFAAPGVANSCGQHVPGGQPVAAAEEPLHAAVVVGRAARAVPQHHGGAQLHRHSWHQPADATQHRSGQAL